MKHINTDLLYEELTYQVRGAIFNVYNSLGFGHKEQVYQKALEVEFKKMQIPYKREQSLDVIYNEEKVGNYRPDFVIDDKIIIELKAVEFMPKTFETQLLQYLKTTGFQLGLLVNFGAPRLDIRRFVWTRKKINTDKNDPLKSNLRKSASNLCKSLLIAVITSVLFLTLGTTTAHAATVTWDGGASTTEWNTANNWSNNAVPTSSDDVTIDNAAVVATTTAINFSTLTIGSGTNTTSLTLTANIGTGGSITINNAGTLTQNNKVQQTISGTLTINSGGNLTHTANTTANTYNVNFSAATITVNSGGTINVTAKGYSPRNGPGITSCGSGNGAGASHGGLGSSGSGCSGGNTYDSVTNPTDLGSGGGGGASNQAGGGAVLLSISGTLTVGGTVSAIGQTGTSGGGGAGAGGTINITTGALTGTGTISANGIVNIGGASGGGGGGRISIKYNTDTSSLSTLSAYGGGLGGPGTIYKANQSGTNRTLIIDNNDVNSYNQGSELDDYSIGLDSIVLQNTGNLHIKSGSSMIISSSQINNGVGDVTGILSNDGTLTLPSSYTLDGYILWANKTGIISGLTNLTIGSTGKLSHGYNTTTKTNYINLSLTNLTINSSGSIDISGKGYSEGNGPGAGCGGGNGHGGSHGGMGGKGSSCTSDGVTNDSVINPNDLGSGGSSYTGLAYGGGLLALNITDTLTINGTINTDGIYREGAGAGGTVNITTGTLAGTGTITANGGSNNGVYGGSGGGGGGGGRIAIKYTTDSSSLSTLSAYGGAGPYANGAPGTIYKKSAAQTYGTLTVDNNSVDSTTAYAGLESNNNSYQFDDIILKRTGKLEIKSGATLTFGGAYVNANGDTTGVLINHGTLALPSSYTLSGYTLISNSINTISGLTDLTIGSTGILTHDTNTTTKTNFINLSLTNLTINSGGSINLNGKGYSAGNGSGVGSACSSSPFGGPGGAHGGVGGAARGCSATTATNDSVSNPTDLGSGGTVSSTSIGGGAIILTISGTLTVNGSITANASAFTSSSDGGAAAGGTVNITAGTFTGIGSISVNGANNYASSWGGGGGGGGRIAIKYNTDSSSLSTLSAYGGTGYSDSGLRIITNGGSGTIYKATQAGGSKTLIIDNNSTDSGNNGAELDDYTIAFDSIVLKNKGILHIKSGSSMTVVANEINNSVGDNSGILSNDGTLILPSTYTLNNYTLWANANGTISTLANLTIGSTGILSHAFNTTSKANYINLSLTNLTINSGGSINVNGKGYIYTNGPGAGASSCGSFPYGGAGGGHGGRGGAPRDCSSMTGRSNDSLTNPIDLGSGGGNASDSRGGGLLILTISNTLTVNGSISSNGSSIITASDGGGAAGGGINITVGTFTGNGSITANGANNYASHYGGGGGAGGRITISLTTNTYTGTSIATPGTGYSSQADGSGGSGTVYFNNPTLINVSVTAVTPNTNSITGVKTIAFWVKPTSTTTNFLKLASGVEIGVSSGTITTSGITSPTTYINGSAGGTITSGSWNHVSVTTGTGITANNVTLGQNSGGYLSGQIDDVRFYTSEYSSSQVSSLYTQQNSIDSNISTTSSAEEYAPATPVSYWKLDDATGTTAKDTTTTANNGTLGGTTLPTWQGEDQCISGKCLYFDGTSSKVTAANSANGIQSVSFWVKPKTTTQGLIQLASGYYVNVSSGVVSATGFSNPTIYVNGVVNGAVAANQWNHIAVTTGTSFTADSIILGQASAVVLNGYMDEIKIYDFALSSAQVKSAYTARGTAQGASAVLGIASNNNYSVLNQGLLGYWKFDESSGNASDSSGNSLTLTNNNTTTYTGGKFGNGPTFNGSTQYFNTATTVTGVRTVAFWVKPASNTNNYINLTSGIRITSSSGTVSATGFTSPSIYVNGTLNGTITANTWNHVLVTTSTSFNPNAIEVGRANSAYLSSGSLIDEVRFYNRQFTLPEITQLYNFAPGPVAYYNFDENTGSTVNDRSGNANTGTWNGSGSPHWKPGKNGSAGNFDGSSDYVNISEIDDFSGISNGSIEGWFKLDILNNPNTDGEQTIYNFSNGSDTQNLLLLDVGSTGYVRVLIRPNSGTSIDAITATGTIAANQWYHLAFVVDSSGNSLYINGVKQSLTYTSGSTSTQAFLNTPVSPLYNWIGSSRWSNAQQREVDGSIDDVKVYNYARTQQQIVEDMTNGSDVGGSGYVSANSSTGGSIAKPVGYWKFDEGYSTTANNYGNGGTALNGTLTGMSSPATSTSGWTQSGKVGKALVFDGTNDYITKTSATGLPSGSAARTFTAWVKPSVGTQDKVVMAINDTSGSNQSFIFEPSAGASQRIFTDGVNVANNITSTKALTLNEWNYVAFTLDGSNGWKYYINGILATSGTFAAAINTTSTNVSVSIGRREDGANAGNYWNGSIDEPKIYSYALTADQVKMDMNQGAAEVLGALGNNTTAGSPQAASQEYCIPGDASTCSAPVARWDFEEATGTTANDSSGNANTGTLTSGPTWVNGKSGNGKAISFDGTDDYVSFTTTITGVKTVGFWVNPATTTQYLLDFDGGTHYISASTGTVSATGFTSPTIYVNGVSGGTITANAWNYIEVTTATAFNTTTSMTFGKSGSNYLNGKIDQVRIFNYARSAAQIAWDYNKGAPVGHWRMDECQGTSATDVSGNANTGTITIGSNGTQTTAGTCTDGSSASAWNNGVSGKRNYSLNFDGTDDYISLASTSNLTTNEYTYAAWVYIDSLPSSGAYKTIFSIGNGSTVDQDLWVSNSYAGTTGFSLISYPSSGGANIATQGTAASSGIWYHVVGVRNTTTDTIKVYVDGNQVASSAISSDSAGYGSAIAKIGVRVDNSGKFGGKIDDARVYNYPLTATQVKTLFSEGAYRVGPSTGAP